MGYNHDMLPAAPEVADSVLTLCFHLPDVVESIGAASCDPVLLARLAVTAKSLHGFILKPEFAAARAHDLANAGSKHLAHCKSLAEIAAGMAASKLCSADSLNHVYFEMGGGVEVKRMSKPFLHEVGKILKKFPDCRAHIEGHVAPGAPSSVAMSCARQRAESVIAELVKLGVERSQLSCKSWGKKVSSLWSYDGHSTARAELFFLNGEMRFPEVPDVYEQALQLPQSQSESEEEHWRGPRFYFGASSDSEDEESSDDESESEFSETGVPLLLD